ncbi:MAG: tRNA (adenosine(37)-N6)-threonylcarbamoyltransferase complex transferase subunit TsaD [Patescibacteria group bacterium]
MKILAIETSCDETAIALVEAKSGINPPVGGLQFEIIKNLVASQIKIHAPFGGVVPNLAKREHLKNLPILYEKIKNLKIGKLKLDLIAVTVGPGLEPALWTGINFSKEVYKEIKKRGNKEIKLIGVNHLEGHLYSFLLNQKREISNIFPAIALIISGGHTILLLMKDLMHYKKIGETRDDAVGEAFDKVARLLKLPYPGGPEIEKLAKKGNHSAINFPRPMLNQKNYDFSFSGLKTAVLYYMRDSKNKKDFLADVAASFQQAAFEVLINKTLRAAKEFNAKSIMVSGGVASNFSLQKNLKLKIKNEKLKINVFFPPKRFCGDNAAMVAASGYINYLKGKKRRLTANGNLTI